MRLNPSSVRRSRSLRLAAGGLASTGLLALSLLAQGDDTNRPAAGAAIPKSVFVAQGDIGKNPFYPHSTRLRPKPTENSTKAPVTQDFSQFLVLRGITGPPERRIALINNLTFTTGEEGEVKAGSGKVKIRVLEIRDKSVVVSIAGTSAPKELQLQETLLPVFK